MEIAYGECHCGCKRKTKIANRSRSRERDRMVKGEPLKFWGTHGRGKSRPEIVQPDDPAIRHVALTKGQVTVIDAEDFDFLSQWKWYAYVSVKSGKFYAARGTCVGGKFREITMQSTIFYAPKGMIVDHKDQNGLNNRKSNFRIANKSQNTINSPVKKNCRSGCNGVYWNKATQSWRSRIKVNGVIFELGCHLELDSAIAARNKAEIFHFGEFSPHFKSAQLEIDDLSL